MTTLGALFLCLNTLVQNFLKFNRLYFVYTCNFLLCFQNIEIYQRHNINCKTPRSWLSFPLYIFLFSHYSEGIIEDLGSCLGCSDRENAQHFTNRFSHKRMFFSVVFPNLEDPSNLHKPSHTRESKSIVGKCNDLIHY